MNVEDFAATFIQSMGAALLQYAAAQVAMAAQAFTADWCSICRASSGGSTATAAAASAGGADAWSQHGSSRSGP
jgi:hypothetical protein